MSGLPDTIRAAIIKALSSNNDAFSAAMTSIKDVENLPAATLAEIKQKSTTAKGYLFERYCAHYLISVQGFSTVCRTSELPSNYRSYFSLESQDKGIDLVGLRYVYTNGVALPTWYAIQCKYKAKGEKVNFTELSTFYTLAYRTGIPGEGWKGYVLMSNSSKRPYIPSLSNKDIILLKQQLSAIPDWYAFVGWYGNVLGTGEVAKGMISPGVKPQSIQEIRAARCLALESKSK